MLLEFFHNILRLLEAMLIYPSALRDISLPSRKSIHDAFLKPNHRPLESLANEITQLLTAPVDIHHMLSMSEKMRRQYRQKLQDSPACMLPSYNHTLPTGLETGTFLSLDVGGSTFRVALVELAGRSRGADALNILRMSVTKIDKSVRQLQGTAFFDWMAEKIQGMLMETSEDLGHHDKPLPVGLAWSFPLDQTSAKGGKIQEMGKGFHCHHGTVGQDLGELIVDACRRRNLHVRMDAIINDSSATLLSRAYLEPSTCMSLILGTGTNAAVYLPVSAIGKPKFGKREPSWHAQAERVITNTELSMFGKGVLPETRWDELLNQSTLIPDFQPLEYMTTGRYLGEILRLIMVEAVETANLFDGELPPSLCEPYFLDTAVLATLEQDRSAGMSESGVYMQDILSLREPPSPADLAFLRVATESISHRAAVYLATAIHALWVLKRESELTQNPSPESNKTTIGCAGSVIQKYPGFRTRCQGYLGQMIVSDSTPTESFRFGQIILEPADEAAILGAAVAVAVCAPENV